MLRLPQSAPGVRACPACVVQALVSVYDMEKLC